MSLVPKFGSIPVLPAPPVDLTKALNRADLTRNLDPDCDLAQYETKTFLDFALAIRRAKGIIFRMQRGVSSEEITLIHAFLKAEGLMHEHGKADPRMPYIFAELLTHLDEYDYALACLKNVEAVLVVPSISVSLSISEVQQSRARRARESRQGVNFQCFSSYTNQ
jgi:hypothetical protein